MRHSAFAPVAIAVNDIETEDNDVKFTGIDLESGDRVVITLARDRTHPLAAPSAAPSLVIFLAVEPVDIAAALPPACR